MGVLWPDGSYEVVRPRRVLDSNRMPVVDYTDPEHVAGPLPGRKVEQADLSWQVALDPAFWPVLQGDMIRSLDDDVTLVVVAPPEPLLVGTAAALAPVSYVRITARRQQAVQQPQSDAARV